MPAPSRTQRPAAVIGRMLVLGGVTSLGTRLLLDTELDPMVVSHRAGTKRARRTP